MDGVLKPPKYKESFFTLTLTLSPQGRGKNTGRFQGEDNRMILFTWILRSSRSMTERRS